MKSTLTLAVVTGSMLAVAVACGRGAKDDGEPAETRTTSAQAAGPSTAPRTRASCDTRAEKASCTEYPVGASLGLERSLCDAEKGRFALTACPAGERLGTCTMSGGELRIYYGDDHGPTIAEAQADCESPAASGRFSAAPR